MVKYRNYILLLVAGIGMLLAACSKGEQEDASWYKPVDDFVNAHLSLMQTNPDSMVILVKELPCDGKPELVEQWKRLIIAKCYYLKGIDAESIALIDTVNAFCRNHPGEKSTYKLQSYADNLRGVLFQAVAQRDSAFACYEKAYRGLMRLDNRDVAVDICINAADISRQQGRLADATSWYRRANFLADSLHITDSQNCILAGLGQVYNDLQNYQLAHYYFRKAERQYPPKTPKDAHFFYNSWGNVFSSQGKHADALRCFRKAQKAAEIVNQPFMTAVVNSNLGQTYMELNQLDSAQKYIDFTAQFFMQKPDMQNDVQFFVDGLKASLAMRQNKLAEADAILRKPYVLSKMSPNYLYLHHRGLASLYERKGNYAKALEYRKLMSQYDDSLRNAIMRSNVGESELRFKQDTAIIRRDLNLQTARAQARSSRVIFSLITGLLIIGVLSLVMFYRYKSLRHRHQHNREMSRMLALKMENVRNRFSPHFVFNVLNVFVSSLPKGVSARPLQLLIQVLRANLLTCDKVAVSLEEELMMVSSYATLRHVTNPFLPMPEIVIDKDVDMAQRLPSMIVQIPVENALKHAFVGMEETDEKPMLKIHLWMEQGMLRIDVMDNGCGGVGQTDRRKKPNSAVSTGTGLKILHSTIDNLNACNRQKMYFRIQSVKDGETKGTWVSIGVPVDYNFNVYDL